jgi:hypothetical protein
MYMFVATKSGKVTITPKSFTPAVDPDNPLNATNLDIAVLTDACEPTACLVFGLSSVTFNVTMGQTYRVIVEGKGLYAETTLYDLVTTCTP